MPPDLNTEFTIEVRPNFREICTHASEIDLHLHYCTDVHFHTPGLSMPSDLNTAFTIEVRPYFREICTHTSEIYLHLH